MRRLSTLALAFMLVPGAVRGAPPDPLDDTSLFAFPGSVVSPPAAASAGLAMADRWLADGPFDNPSNAFGRKGSLSPMLLRVSRQDLRADNLRFDDQLFFVDGSGAWAGLPIRSFGLAVYFHQPTLRREENAFQRGEVGGPVEPAVLQTGSTAREWRAGLALSAGTPTLRVGIAPEWTRRDDEYLRHEVSGSPDAGTRTVAFSGDGVGVSAGANWEHDSEEGLPFAIGVGGRWIPALDLEVGWRVDSPLRQVDTTFSVQRESGWEAGASLRTGFGPALRVFAGAGVRSALEWSGFGVTAGRAVLWSVAAEYRDPEEPWTARFGLGQEQQDGVPEPRAGVVSLGFGWSWGNSGLDLGILRRGIRRPSQPTSFDDRLVGSLHFAW